MNSFLSACGLDDSLRLVVTRPGADEPRTRLLRQPFAILGRDPGADLVLDHSAVARRHVYVQVVAGWAFWVNMESAADRRRGGDVQTTGWLHGDQVLTLGPYTIKRAPAGLLDHDDPGAPPPEAPLVSLGADQGLPEASLEFLNGPSRSTTWPMRRVMSLVGSAAGCKFRLTDPSVSRFHAALVRTPGALWIVDLLGREGLRINGERTRAGLLEDGDELTIGRYRMRLRSRPDEQGGGVASISPPPSLAIPTGRALATTREPDRPRAPIPFPTSLEVAPNPVFSIEPASAPQDVTAAMLVPLVNQFGQMQQQMFDQFHQAMGMMVQMFGRMHQDQMEVIRTELDRLRDLTDEFHSLKDELAARTRVDLAREESRVNERPAAARTAPPPAAAAPVSPIPAPTLPPLAAFVGAAAAKPAQPAAKPPAAASDRDTVAWLHQRIANLQQERETRWQRILKLLPGAS